MSGGVASLNRLCENPADLSAGNRINAIPPARRRNPQDPQDEVQPRLVAAVMLPGMLPVCSSAKERSILVGSVAGCMLGGLDVVPVG